MTSRGHPSTFGGDVSNLWQIGGKAPARGLSWWWWWWLIMLPGKREDDPGRQLMVLWSTKDTEKIDIAGEVWKRNYSPSKSYNGARVFDGVVASWWFDGNTMHEPWVLENGRIALVEKSHRVAGAVVPLWEKRLSTGMSADLTSFWIDARRSMGKTGPQNINVQIEPSTDLGSRISNRVRKWPGGFGYEISRLRHAHAIATIDGEEVIGTAYFQKVAVHSPAAPWFWGVLHFSDGSYLDWFQPHIGGRALRRSNKSWSFIDMAGSIATGEGALWIDAERNRSERFSIVKISVDPQGSHQNALPVFTVHLANGRTKIKVVTKAVSRANWTFDQPARGGMLSHFTYNEYPLTVQSLQIRDEIGTRNRQNWTWIRGNAEQAWGFLH